ncbi:D-glycero-alpha-D-manno-heptose-1,7-bisphosphate 7-phosphatase [Desulfovibrio litoralis]|nr:HAD family hydrolase [Desulfovibrio litoralis]
MKKAVFFDRDGVLNHDSGYVYKIEDFKWIKGAKEAIKLFNDRDYLVFVVTNQSGIARGFYTEHELKSLHAYMQQELKSANAHIDEFVYCPHHPEATVAEFKQNCQCRKPQPGMLTYLLKKWKLNPQNCILIGDKKRDLDAAENAEIKGYLFNAITENYEQKQEIETDLCAFVKSKVFNQD